MRVVHIIKIIELMMSSIVGDVRTWITNQSEQQDEFIQD